MRKTTQPMRKFANIEHTVVLNVAHDVLCFAVAHGIGLDDGESALHLCASLAQSETRQETRQRGSLDSKQ